MILSMTPTGIVYQDDLKPFASWMSSKLKYAARMDFPGSNSQRRRRMLSRWHKSIGGPIVAFCVSGLRSCEVLVTQTEVKALPLPELDYYTLEKIWGILSRV